MPRNFCGFVDLDDSTAPEIVATMTKRLNINDLYQSTHESLSKAHFGKLYSSHFPEPKSETFVRQLQNDYLITSFSHLIRLEDLGKKLDCDLSGISDQEIFLRCYLKWGKDMVFHLEGDWAFAIWNRAKEELFLARNPHGDGTLFFYHNSNKLYFSSLITGLVNVPGIPNEVDEEKLFMECLTVTGFKTKTVYKDIHFLKPGHFMTFSKGSLQSTQYWKPLETRQIRYTNDQEYFDAFHEEYDRAVRDRLKLTENWGFAISGGLDSAATAGVASRYFKERNETMEALCFVPNYKDTENPDPQIVAGDESPYAQATADLNGNMRLNLVTKEVPFWKYTEEYRDFFGTPPHVAGVLFTDALAEDAGRRRMPLVMIGQGGNQGLSFEGLPSHFNLKQYYTDLRHGLRQNLNTQELIRFFFKAMTSGTAKSLKSSKNERRKKLSKLIQRRTLLTDEFIAKVKGIDLLEEQFYTNEHKLLPGEFKLKKRLNPGTHCRHGLWNQIGVAYDVTFIDPTRDTKFLELVLSIPNHLFHRKNVEKFLFKESFKKMVPPKVVGYKKTGINLSDLTYRFQEDIGHLKSLIESKKQDPVFNEMINPEKLQRFCTELEGKSSISTSFTSELYSKSPSLFHSLLV